MKTRKVIDGDRTYLIDEEYSKYLARAIELMYLVRGNENTVEIILTSETGMSASSLRAVLTTAYDVYAGKNILFTRWIETDPAKTYFPLI